VLRKRPKFLSTLSAIFECGVVLRGHFALSESLSLINLERISEDSIVHLPCQENQSANERDTISLCCCLMENKIIRKSRDLVRKNYKFIKYYESSK
jgi:hypothetical protein